MFAVEGAAVAAAGILRLAYAPPLRAQHEALGAADALGTRLAALTKSAALVAVPVDLTICDAFPVTHAWQPRALAGALVALALGLLAWRRRGPAVLLVLALVPSLQVVPIMRWWSPHYVYLPAVFVAMLAGELVDRLGDRHVAATWTLTGLLGVASVIDARKYRSDVALWTPEVTARASCREGQFYLGEVEREARRWDAAARRYEAALAPRPGMLAYVDRRAALVNLGTVRLEQRRFAEGRAAFERALEGTADAHARRQIVHNLAAAALGSGDAAEADRLLAEETSRPDALPASLVVRAMALEKLGRSGEATELLARARAAGLAPPSAR
jgi:tetratricopeptide (TPR) repeat protein